MPTPGPPALCAFDAPLELSLVRGIPASSRISGAWLSEDGLNLVYASAPQESTEYDLFSTDRANASAAFRQAVPIAELNTDAIERRPVLTRDGLTIFFESDRLGDSSDIFMAERKSSRDAFGTAQRVEQVSTRRNDVPGSLSYDGLTLFFSADRLGGPGAENLYFAKRTQAADFADEFLISSVDSDGSNITPLAGADELTLYFSSNREQQDSGHYVLHYAHREKPSGFYGLPQPVPGLSDRSTLGAWISSDQCTLLLERELSAGGRDYKLYFARR
jgi:hypothetical protein